MQELSVIEDRDAFAAPTPDLPTQSSSSVRFVDHVSELVALYEPTLNIVTLRRPSSAKLAAEAQQAAAQVGFRQLFTVSTDYAKENIRSQLAEFPGLADDVAFLAEVLTDLVDCDGVGVRLTRLDSAMCPRFHVDRVVARVVVTYQGPGTEFVSAEHVDRSYLGHAACGASDETSGLLLKPDGVQAATTFDVVLLKGEAWFDNEGRGAVHRSPAVPPDTSRLVLTLDLV